MASLHGASSSRFLTPGTVLILLMAVSAFWALRIYYWSVTVEEPFSDMADFLAVADNLYYRGSLAWSGFWQSYMPPTLPVLRVVQMWVAGPSLDAWRFYQTLILFLSLIWLMRELWIVSRSKALVCALLIIVAMSRPSIFWSLKFSRESIAEAFFYLCGASVLWAWRKGGWWRYLLVGGLWMAAVQNRANTLLSLALLFPWLLFSPQVWRDALSLRVRRAVCVGLGAFLIWLPWGVRGYMLYGAPVVLSTQGPFVFFWELGRVPVQISETETKWVHSQDLQTELSQTMPTDYAAAKYTSALIRAWLRDNWRDLFPIMWNRVVRTSWDRTIYLTKVSREDLFPGKWDGYLFDKHAVTFWIGMIGFAVLALFSPLVAPLAILVVGSWLNAIPVLGYPRVVESSIPLLLWINVLILVGMVNILRGQPFFDRREAPRAPSSF